MPHKLKVLSGDQLVKFFGRFGFSLRSMNGSHMRIVRRTDQGDQMLTIPRHKEIRKGTLKVVYHQASRFVAGIDLDEFFYTE